LIIVDDISDRRLYEWLEADDEYEPDEEEAEDDDYVCPWEMDY
jgi:hypothetical protein